MKTSGFPKRIEIELTNCCNLKCSYCPRRYGVGNEGYMDLGLFKKIITEAKSYPDIALQIHRRGESLLHPDFIEILSCLKGKFKEVQLATNAVLLDKEKSEAICETVTFISFSIDLPQNYAKRKGLDTYKTIENNIMEFLKINKKAKTQVSTVEDISLTDDDVLRFRQFWLGKVDRVRIYEEHSVGGVYGAVREKRKDRFTCVKPFTDLVIYWDGKVVRCNHDWSNRPLGYMNESNISQIWHGQEFERIRREQLNLTFSDEVCNKCGSWYAQEGMQGTGYIFEGKNESTFNSSSFIA